MGNFRSTLPGWQLLLCVMGSIGVVRFHAGCGDQACLTMPSKLVWLHYFILWTSAFELLNEGVLPDVSRLQIN